MRLAWDCMSGKRLVVALAALEGWRSPSLAKLHPATKGPFLRRIVGKLHLQGNDARGTAGKTGTRCAKNDMAATLFLPPLELGLAWPSSPAQKSISRTNSH